MLDLPGLNASVSSSLLSFLSSFLSFLSSSFPDTLVSMIFNDDDDDVVNSFLVIVDVVDDDDHELLSNLFLFPESRHDVDDPEAPFQKSQAAGLLVAGGLVDAAAVVETMNCSILNSVAQAWYRRPS
jgi:hypothetical protein